MWHAEVTTQNRISKCAVVIISAVNLRRMHHLLFGNPIKNKIPMKTRGFHRSGFQILDLLSNKILIHIDMYCN